MTETTSATPKKRGGGLNSMLIADLKSMAGGLGISGAEGMRKAQLISAIKGAQSGGSSGSSADASAASEPAAQPSSRSSRSRRPSKGADSSDGANPSDGAGAPSGDPSAAGSAAGSASGSASGSVQDGGTRSGGRSDGQSGGRSDGQTGDRSDGQSGGRSDGQSGGRSDGQAEDQAGGPSGSGDRGRRSSQRNDDQAETTRPEQGRQGNQGNQGNQGGNQQKDQPNQGGQGNQGASSNNQGNQKDQSGDASYDEGGSRRNRRRRGRDRDRTDRPATPANRPASGNRGEPDTTVLDDDILVPAAGILDVLDNYAFVRTSGYLPGVDDVYLSLSMVRKFGLRRGDAIVGQVRQPRDGERKEKFNPMVRIDSVNGADPETSKTRVDFASLTPVHPSERLRLETVPTNLIGRVIDLAAPIGKGQRGLIVSPPQAGKTRVLQSIATSITTNNPECHLMVVLVDERPEEVTEFERSVKGEVVSSTFDRPPSDHTLVAELAIERAKRLVELGHDVVVLLDGITRLGRAYHLSAPPSGRVLPGGVDSAALHPTKRFFGAARNVENGGSLTILATALVETGSPTDEALFEEFRDTGNLEIRLRRELADQRLFPAIDAVASGTRREELLMSQQELAIVWELRRLLSDLDGRQALEQLVERLGRNRTNIELLMQVQKAAAQD